MEDKERVRTDNTTQFNRLRGEIHDGCPCGEQSLLPNAQQTGHVEEPAIKSDLMQLIDHGH